MYIPMGFIYLALLYVVFNSVFIALSVGGIFAFTAYALLAFCTHRNPRYMWNGLVLLLVTSAAVWILLDFYATA